MTTTPTTPTPPAANEAPTRRPDGDREREYASSEYAAYQILRLAAELPGTCGRRRMARIIGGYPVPFRSEEEAAQVGEYAIEIDWPLRELVRLIDALVQGGLLAQSVGPRPLVCVTRAGCRTLEALAIDQHTRP